MEYVFMSERLLLLLHISCLAGGNRSCAFWWGIFINANP
jgi:hypothetical protein